MMGLTHWGRVTQICVSKFTIIGSDNGLSLIRHQAIIWTNAEILLIRTLGTNFSEILIQIHTFSNKKMHSKKSSGKCRPFCLGLNVLKLNHVRKRGPWGLFYWRWYAKPVSNLGRKDTHIKLWDVMTTIMGYDDSNFNGGLPKPPLKLCHGWVTTSIWNNGCNDLSLP